MDDQDLSLVSIERLKTEIEKRCDFYVIGHSRRDGSKKLFDVAWDGHYLKVLGLCVQLIFDILRKGE